MILLAGLFIQVTLASSYTWTYNDWVNQVWKKWGNNMVNKNVKYTCKTIRLSGISGIIETPNFPSHYPNNAECKWIIEVPKEFTEIQLDLFKFNLDNPKWSRLCFKDYIEIYQFHNNKKEKQGSYCGKKAGSNITIFSNKAEIIFKSNSYRTKKGFKIRWKGVKGCGGVYLGDSKKLGHIRLSKSKKTQKRFYCEWRLKSPALHNQIEIKIDSLNFTRSYSSCKRGHMLVLDSNGEEVGKYCDSKVPRIIRISGNEARIILKISRKTKDHRFKASWTSSEELHSDDQCGIASEEHNNRIRRLVGGTPAIQSSWPWIVQVRTIIMDNNFRLKTVTCGGVIISPWYILTAAHCVVRKLRVIKYEILVGTVTEYINKENIITLSTNDVIPHPHFKWNGKGRPKHDIALLRLREKLKFGYKIKAICLPHNSKVDIYNKNCEFAGWGKTHENSYHSEHLNQIDARLWGHCDNSNSVLCVTYGKGKTIGACKGDSGSPVVCQYDDGRKYLVSILSYGAKTCPSTVDGHADVSYYLSWIRNILKTNILIQNNNY